MNTVRSGIHVTLRIRHCVCCGYAGPELQGDTAVVHFQCPSCAADLYARPPRSYYEMEGFDEAEALAGAAAPVDLPKDAVRFMGLAETCVLGAITLLVVTFMAAHVVGLV